jgi:predicted PurR-regulated permease PerM
MTSSTVTTALQEPAEMSDNHAVVPPGGSPATATETVIRLAVLALLVIWCFRIVQPFVIPVVWGMIIAVAIHPLYKRLAGLMGGRRKLAAALITLLFLVSLMVPAFLLTQLLVENVATLAQHVRAEHISIPPPPDSVIEWPLVGEPLAKIWTLAATNLSEALKLVQPQLKSFGVWLVGLAASAGVGMIMFVFAVIIAGVMLAHSGGSHRWVHGLSRKLVGDEHGDNMADLAETTIRSVTRGVLGVAVIQSLLAGLGFAVVGLPGTGIWALLCLISATVQLGVGPIVIPAVIYVFATGSTLTAVLFLIWSVIVLLLDNILKPLLLGRGVDVPMLVIFLGSIGGMLMMGIVGLFIGAVVLALGYKLLQGWMKLEVPVPEAGADH